MTTIRIKRAPHVLNFDCDGVKWRADIRPLSGRQYDALQADAVGASTRVALGLWASILDENLEWVDGLQADDGTDISAVQRLDSATRVEVINQLGALWVSESLTAYLEVIKKAGAEGKAPTG